MRRFSQNDETELVALEAELEHDVGDFYSLHWPDFPPPVARFAATVRRVSAPHSSRRSYGASHWLLGRRMWRASAVLFAIGLLGLASMATGLLQLPHGSRPSEDPNALPFGESLANVAGPAASLQQLTGEADLVVTGRVTAIVGTETRPFPAGEGTTSAVAYTLLTFRVDRYARGEGPDVLTIRHPGDLTTTRGPREFPGPALDQPLLLFLTTVDASSDVWEAVRGPWGAIHTRDGALYYAWGEEPPRIVEFFAGMTLDEAADVVTTLAR